MHPTTTCQGEATTCREELRLATAEQHATRRELDRNHRFQMLLNAVLQMALEPLPLHQQLRRALGLMFTEEWRMLDGRGLIYGLKLPAKRGWTRETFHGLLGEHLPATEMAEEQCFCGAKLPTLEELREAEEVSLRHPGTETWPPHLCLPLMCEECIIGLGIFFLDREATNDETEENACWSLCNVLAGVMRRKRIEEAFQESLRNLERSLHGTVDALSTATEIRDPYTAGHQQRVAHFACAMGHAMGLPADRIKGIHIAGALHDIGKLSIPAEILAKPGRLSEAEFLLIKGHPQVGYDILKNVEFPWPVADIVRQHHEKCDGTGYPLGLRREELLLEARLLMVADVVEAMASHRPYRPSLGLDRALEEIDRGSGTTFDPQVVEMCLDLFATGEARRGWTEHGRLPCLSHWKC